MMDELPMIYSTCIMVFANLRVFPETNKNNRILSAGLLIYSVSVTAMYLYLNNPVFHEVCYGLLVAVLFLVPPMQFYYIKKNYPQYRNRVGGLWKLFTYGAGSYLAGFMVWGIDNNFCEAVRGLREQVGYPFRVFLELHVWWHLGTAIGTYASVLSVTQLRLLVCGRKDVYIKWVGGVFPFLTSTLSKDDIAKLVSKKKSLFADAQSGRYAVAARDIKEGELVLKGKAFGIATTHACRKECCSSCFNVYTMASSLPFSCPICSSVYYCSAKCQQSHTPLHSQYECSRFKDLNSIPSSASAFQKLLSSIDQKLESDPTTVAVGSGTTEPLTSLMESCYERNDIMNLARWILSFCIRVEIEQEFGLRSCELPSHKDFLELIPNDECLSCAERIQFHGLYTLFSGLKKVDKKSLGKGFSELFVHVFPTVQDLITVISIRQCNGFGLWDSELECMGNAVYPAASFFNHSCEKNLERQLGMKRIGDDLNEAVDESLIQGMNSLSLDGLSEEEMAKEKRKLEIWKALDLQVENVLFAKKNIVEGERLTHSYVDGGLEREIRRNELKETYYFDCLCEKCMRGE
ncbi:UNVERIFIED_CONTAM: Alkaline ceramidase 3 [Siphonaria sp. JEL0065]|nr:Alkaline ceramidase 3 [Siphonaria sp. JEL0065]